LWIVAGVCLFLIALVWLVFGQTLRHDFVNYDDLEYISKNPEVTAGLTRHGIVWAFSHTVSANWHPLTMITHMLDCQLYGLKPGGHHFTNVVLHTVATLLLFFLLKKMIGGPSSPRRVFDRTGNIWPSAFVAALFAIHPLRVESVAWVAERKDVLSAVFFMLTLAAYLRYVDKPSGASYLLVVLLFALGLMSKPMLVTLPFVLLLLDYWPLSRPSPPVSTTCAGHSLPRQDRRSIVRTLIGEKVPLFFLAAIAAGIALVLQRNAMTPIETIPFWARLYNAAVSSVVYIWQMFWPAKLALLYPLPAGALSGWELILALALLSGLTYIAWVRRKQNPYFITGWLWYLGMLLPVIGLVQVGTQAHADRYTYLPQIGLYLAATWAAAELSASWRYRRQILTSLAAVVIGLLTWRSWIQTGYWKNSESIWTRTLAVTSNNAVAHRDLGYVLLKNEQVDDAIFHLEEALKIWPDFRGGRTNPENVRLHEKLAAAFLAKGRVADAIVHYQDAIQLRPDNADFHDKLAALLWQQGQTDQAIEHWQKALSIHPDDPNFHSSIGMALLRKQLAGEAIVHYEKALARAPQSIVALNNLALLLSTCPEARFRNGSRAVQLAEEADRLASRQNPIVARTLAAAYAESGQFHDAINATERAMNLATAQGNKVLARDLQMDIDLYQMNFPRRERAP
jgi:tetratricopeptide (TPR) repeat protein